MSTSLAWSRRADWLPIAAVVAAIVMRSWFFLTWDEAYFDSDQAIVGLMAKHLTEGRARPLFFYGQEYMLGVEAWAMAPVFLVLGPTVFALHLTMLLFNVAAALLLWRLLIREARLTPGGAAMAVLPFALAPVVLSAHLIEAQGGNPEPFLWVGVLWVVRRRPLLLGTLAAVAFLHREFTIYAMPALAVAALWQLRLDGGGRDRRVAEIRHWMMTAFAFIVVFLAIQALKPSADLMGPATAGMRAPDRPQDNLTQIRNRILWDPGAMPARIAALPNEHFALLLGVKGLDPRVVAIGSSVPVGWPELVPLVVAAAVVWPLALVRGTRTPAPKGALIFPLYLLLIAAQSALVYAVTREPSLYLLRYGLLALLAPVGVSALLLQPWRLWGVRLATTVLLALLAGTAAIDHLRVIQDGYRGKAPLQFADAAARLDERGVRIGRAGYWRSYAIAFLTRERVKLTSTEVLRIQEYEDLADAAEPHVLVVQEQPCAQGVPEDRVGAWYLCGP
jgi:hypothetical protein